MSRRALVPDDLDQMVPLVSQRQGTSRFSLGATSISPDLVANMMLEPLPAIEVVVIDGQLRAVLTASNHSEQDRIARLDILVDPMAVRAVGPDVAHFCEAQGQHLGLRKWWVWSLEDELDVSAVLGEAARPAGVLAEHARRGPRMYVGLRAYEVWVTDG